MPDVLAHGLRVLFCGINPGLYSAAVGHHFARPGNRFWRVLHLSGLTDRQLDPAEDAELVHYGLGVTNLVARATASAAELSAEELRQGAVALGRKVRLHRPAIVAFAGMGAYRTSFGRPHAVVGPQLEALEGAQLWLLANPSGLQAHYQLSDLVEQYRGLRRAVGGGPGSEVSHPAGRGTAAPRVRR